MLLAPAMGCTPCCFAPETTTRSAGFSLIEVVVALALLGTILLGVAGVFIQAMQSIDAASATSQALGIATSIHEEMRSWSRHETCSCFGASEGGGSFTADSRANPCAGRWQPVIEPGLRGGRATISLEPMGGPTIGASPGLRITVRLDWVARERPRRLSLSSVRF